MSNHNDIVYKETYKGCISVGVLPYLAKSVAESTLQKYKNNQFITVDKLIKTAITDAKKINKTKKIR
mgnify:FL=1